jgi:hypothetical protein
MGIDSYLVTSLASGISPLSLTAAAGLNAGDPTKSLMEHDQDQMTFLWAIAPWDLHNCAHQSGLKDVQMACLSMLGG